MAAITRGSFQVDDNGALLANDANVEALRNLWSSRPEGLELGPGVGSTGAWHVSCHIIAAGCVRRAASGELLWLEMSHVDGNDTYEATLTFQRDQQPTTIALDSDDARRLLDGSTLLGFVEGTSQGHITARGVQDPPDRFDGYSRQNYDQPAGSEDQGGRVWEHWCTTRDLDPDSKLSVSVLTAYLQLCSAAGDRFAATVARGRRDYGHPAQLRALIDAGFTTAESAGWRTTPKPIGREAELQLHEATPAAAYGAAQGLAWSDSEPTYHMYPRRIDQFE
jgi:hypothetical protein